MKTDEIVAKVKEFSKGIEQKDSNLDDLIVRLKNKASNYDCDKISIVSQRTPSIELKTREERFDYNCEQISLSLFDYLSDEEFIRVAYRVILEREADAGGFDHYHSKLHSGKFSRAMVLWFLKRSDEGKAGSKPLVGIYMPLIMSIVRRIPVFGSLVGLGSNIVNLGHLYKSVNTLTLHNEDIYLDLKKQIQSSTYKSK